MVSRKNEQLIQLPSLNALPPSSLGKRPEEEKEEEEEAEAEAEEEKEEKEERQKKEVNPSTVLPGFIISIDPLRKRSR